MATPNNSVILNLTGLVAEEYCYTVELDHGDTILSITGTFRLGNLCVGVHLFYLGLYYTECDPRDLGTNPSSSNGFVSVPNGLVTYENLTPGSVATVLCDQGYTVSSEYNRTCLRDGHWSEDTLDCMRTPSFSPSIILCTIIALTRPLYYGRNGRAPHLELMYAQPMDNFLSTAACDTGCVVAIAVVVVLGFILLLVLSSVVIGLKCRRGCELCEWSCVCRCIQIMLACTPVMFYFCFILLQY